MSNSETVLAIIGSIAACLLFSEMTARRIITTNLTSASIRETPVAEEDHRTE